MPEKFSPSPVEKATVKPVETPVETQVEAEAKPLVYDKLQSMGSDHNQAVLRAEREEQERKRNRNAITKTLGKIGDFFDKLERDSSVNNERRGKPGKPGYNQYTDGNPRDFA